MKWYRAKQNEKRWNHFKGALYLFFTLFLGLSLLSYHSEDPSLNSFGLHLKVSNYCGYAGAFLADFFFQVFGALSFLFLPLGFFRAFQHFRNVNEGWNILRMGFYFLFFGALGSLFNLYFPEMKFQGEMTLGGALGSLWLKGMQPLFHKIGSTLILFSSVFFVFHFVRRGSFLFLFKKSVKNFKSRASSQFLFWL